MKINYLRYVSFGAVIHNFLVEATFNFALQVQRNFDPAHHLYSLSMSALCNIFAPAAESRGR